MFDFHEKRKIRAIIYSKAFIALLILVGIFTARSAYERYTVEREMAEKRDAKLAELEELRLRYQGLESEISRLNDERGIEEELRNRFDAIREGEEVIVILEDPKMTGIVHEAADDLPAVPQNDEPWWSFLRVFKFE